MKYIIKQIGDDFISDELDSLRKQFIEALNYTMESGTVYFDSNARDPLDFYIAYDFQQKNGEYAVYGFNIRDEIIRHFKLDVNKHHSSTQLLTISQQLSKLADELKERYSTESTKSFAELEAEAQDKKNTEYAKSINRSYREVLKEAMAKDEEDRLKINAGHPKIERKDGYQHQTVLLKGKFWK
ncbi:MAG: hypothetical protein ABSB19_18165 [Methylomonas sp.]|jgi:hypothetical protein